MARASVLPTLFATSLLALSLSGCFGTPEPVYVPQSDIPNGWSHDPNNQTEQDPSGQLEIILNHYQFNDQLVAEVIVFSASDIPFFDEGEAIREEVDETAQDSDVTLQKVSEDTTTLDNGHSVTRVEYDIQKKSTTGSAKGKAWVFYWETDEFIAGAIGYATTEYSSLLGSQQDDTQWRNVKAMMLALDW